MAGCRASICTRTRACPTAPRPPPNSSPPPSPPASTSSRSPTTTRPPAGTPPSTRPRRHRPHRRPRHRAQHPARLRQRARARLPDRPRESRRSWRPWSDIREERLHRAEAMVARIGADYALDWDDVLAQTTPGATVGRPHIADALVARGHVTDRSAAFASILHWRGGYYRPHEAPLARRRGAADRRGRRGPRHRASGRPRPRPAVHRQAHPAAGRRRDSSASRSTTATTRPRHVRAGATWHPDSVWSSPARATTTGAASRTASARTPRRPRCTRAIVAHATGAQPFVG